MDKNAIARFRGRHIADPATHCWNWQGALDKDGYGHLTSYRTVYGAHRFSYILA